MVCLLCVFSDYFGMYLEVLICGCKVDFVLVLCMFIKLFMNVVGS